MSHLNVFCKIGDADIGCCLHRIGKVVKYFKASGQAWSLHYGGSGRERAGMGWADRIWCHFDGIGYLV